MPNHCINQITITGPKKDLEAFYNGLKKFKGYDEDLEGEVSIFATYVPMPKELQETTSPGDTPNWYGWCMENWGSKWGDYDTELTLNENEITGWYSSAWGPCNEGQLALSQVFPTLNFEVDYNEPGQMFRGIEKTENGVILESVRWDMNKSDLEELGYDQEEEEEETE